MSLLGMDVGGTHVTCAVVEPGPTGLCAGPTRRTEVDSSAGAEEILGALAQAVRDSVDPRTIDALGIAMPGPFDYPRGISLIKGVAKYEALYGMDVGAALRARLALRAEQHIVFENDANAYVLGEWLAGAARGGRRVIGMTLGTGFGSGFLADGCIVNAGEGLPPDTTLGFVPCRGGIAEDFISRRGICKSFRDLGGDPEHDVADIAEAARAGDACAARVFAEVGALLGEVLRPFVASFRCDVIVIGGAISRAFDLFRDPFAATLNADVKVAISELRDTAALLGAAELARRSAPSH
ncbi:MAG TPA: ROK family protein [Phycisphaerae bacterium]|nr:ROK family protein [Phycisphaerae bacterium]